MERTACSPHPVWGHLFIFFCRYPLPHCRLFCLPGVCRARTGSTACGAPVSTNDPPDPRPHRWRSPECNGVIPRARWLSWLSLRWRRNQTWKRRPAFPVHALDRQLKRYAPSMNPPCFLQISSRGSIPHQAAEPCSPTYGHSHLGAHGESRRSTTRSVLSSPPPSKRLAVVHTSCAEELGLQTVRGRFSFPPSLAPPCGSPAEPFSSVP